MALRRIPRPPLLRHPVRPAAAELLERRTLFAAPNITNIDTGGSAWNEGEYHFLSASFTDADANDRRTAVVDWGDGSAAEVVAMAPGVRGFSTNRHAYPDDQTSVLSQPRRYTITVTVTDSTNQSDTETRQVQVNNVLPVVRLPGELLRAPEGVPLTIPGAFSDPGADTHTFSWRVTRGYFPDVVTVFESTARDLVFTPPDDGFYDVSLEVRDDDGGARTGTTQVWAFDTPPALTVSGAASIDEGAPYVLTLGAADAGADTITRWMVDWGDGNVEAVNGDPPAVTHAYDVPGNYTIRASATDEDGTFSAAPINAAWRAGDADPAFGGPAAGRALTDFPLPIDTYGHDALVYPDGRLLVLRSAWGGNAVEGFVLARFNPDGSFDATFDGDGRLFLPGRWNSGQTLSLQPDNKILFAGVRANGTMFESYLDVFRLNPDGSRDATFGAAGVATAPIGVEHEGTIRSVNDLLLLPDGKIVVPTGSVGLFNSRMQALRFNADGSPDSTFGTGGRTELAPPVGLKTASASQALLAPDGRVILVGAGSAPSGTIPSTAYYGLVAMIGADGSLDTSFGNAGWVTRSFGTTGFNGSAATFVPGGDLVVAYGSYSAATAWDVVRYNLGGTPNAFGPDGVADSAFAWGYVTSVAAAPGNKILVAGTADPVGNGGGMAVARYNADGTLDATFSDDGKVTPIGSANAGAVTVRAAPGDDVVVVGTFDKWMTAVRLNGDGTYDPGFSGDGVVREHRFGPWQFVASGVRSLHVLPDKKILAVGNEPGGRNNLLFMARYLPDGTPDLSFGDFGRVALLAGQSSTLNGVHVDAAGKVLISRAGSVLRYNADGSPDTAFNDAHHTFSPARHFAIAPDGKIVGTGVRGEDGGLVVLRFNPDGTPDTTFGDAGRFEGFPGFANDYEEVKAVTILPDGSVLVGGRGLVRLTAFGAADPDFGSGTGFVPAAPVVMPGYEPHRPNFGVVRGIARAPDGRILTAWSGYNGESPGGFAVARYLADGTPDPTFGNNGQALPGHGGIAEQIALDPAGRILVGGFGSDFDAPGGGFTALRLLPGGSRDLSFGRDGVVAVPSGGGNVGDTFFNQMAPTETGDVLLGGLSRDGRFLLARFRADDERALAVAVNNLPPVVSAGPDRGVVPHAPVTLAGTFTDAPGGEAHTVHWIVRAPSGATVAEAPEPSITFTPTLPGRYTATFTVTDGGLSASDSAAIDVAPRVVGRHVFYDNSAFDGRHAGPGPADDDAIATDKQPLAPGGPAGPFASVTGYSRGINGVMFDVAGELPMTALAGIAGTVGLKTGTGGEPATWADAPRPTQIGIRPGAGVGGSDRVTLTWLDGDAVRNAWLQVTVQAPAEWGLADDVFIFGNLVGETVNAAASWPRVDGTDLRVVRSLMTTRAAVTNPRDHNRDGRVNATDVYLVRAAQGRTLSQVAPPVVAAAAEPTNRSRPARRSSLDLASVRVQL